MPKKSYGETVEKRVKRLFEVLLDHAAHCQCEDNDWGVKLALGEEGKLLQVKTNVAALVRLAEQKGEKLTKDQVRDAISHYLADYLCILRDERHENEKQGCEEWRFSLTLWAKCGDKTTNLTKFSEEWHKRRSEPSKKAVTKPEANAFIPHNFKDSVAIAKPEANASIPHNLKNSGIAKFVGRETVLNQLHEKLQKAERIAISTLSGMGGIGKTELALQYAWQEYRKTTYQGGVCWVDVKGNDPSFDIISFFEYKLKLDKPQGRTSIEQVQDCWQNWIDGDVLIIFDDVRNADRIFEYLPPYEFKNFKVIITTRCEYLSDKIENIHLEELSENDSLDLLRSYIGDDRIDTEIEESKLLCQDLGYLPLALELIARLLKRRSWTIQDTINRLRDKGLKDNGLLGERHTEMTAKGGVKAAFDLSWYELKDEPKTQKLALYLSLFAIAPIKQTWINELFPNEDEYDIEKWLIDNLVGLNLVKSRGSNEYELHRLIHLYLGEKLDQCEFLTTAKQQYCKLFCLKSEKFTQQILSLQKIEELKPLIPHIKQVTQHHYNYIADNYNDNIPYDWNLPIKAVNAFYVSQGFSSQAIQNFEEYIKITENKFGNSDIHLMVLYNDLALILKENGQYDRAMEFLKKALLVAKKYLGENNDQTLTITNAIGDTYREMKDYDKAEETLTYVYYNILGDVINDVIKRKSNNTLPNEEVVKKFSVFILVNNNLALVYQGQKRYNEAENCYKLALQSLEKYRETIYFAQVSNNLGGLYLEMGKQEEAENYFKQARQINKETFDPKYTTNRLNLEHSALLYINQNRLDEAEELLLELLEIQFNLLDDLEPDSLKYLHKIASEYFNKGFYDQAEELSLKINQLYKKFQLTNSIEYCESLNFLATSYTRVNKLEDSIRLSTEAIAIGEKLFYESKIDRNSYTSSSLTIIESYTNLGIALWNVAQKFNQPPQLNQRINFLLEAEIYTRQSLELCQLIFERTNDKTVQYRESHIHNNFGLILEDLEKYSEAEKSYKIALSLRRKELGNEHYLVGQSLLNLAACYDWQKKNDEQTEQMLLECERIWEKLLEPSHPEIVHCYACLAKFYDRKRQFKKAIGYFHKTIENCRIRQDGSIDFYQRKLEECIKRSQNLKPKKSSQSSNKPKGFG